jgi:hypothetical protein
LGNEEVEGAVLGAGSSLVVGDRRREVLVEAEGALAESGTGWRVAEDAAAGVAGVRHEDQGLW